MTQVNFWSSANHHFFRITSINQIVLSIKRGHLRLMKLFRLTIITCSIHLLKSSYCFNLGILIKIVAYPFILSIVVLKLFVNSIFLSFLIFKSFVD